MRLLRGAGRAGGIEIDERGELDADISLYLFSDQPVAVRLRKMRQLLTAGADAARAPRCSRACVTIWSKISPKAWAWRGSPAARPQGRGPAQGARLRWQGARRRRRREAGPSGLIAAVGALRRA